MEVSGKLHAPAALPLGKQPLVPTGQHAGVGTGASLDAMEGSKIIPRQEMNLGHPVCSLLLYRLSYSSSYMYTKHN
jgi:hypothetical protein